MLPYYLLKERRQQLGFEGENLENQKRIQVTASSKMVKLTDIQLRSLEDGSSSAVLYLVKSMSRPDHWYEVDVLAYTCSCPDYPIIKFCKHLCAVQTHFPSSDLASSTELDADISIDSGQRLESAVRVPQSIGLGITVNDLLVNDSGIVDTGGQPTVGDSADISESEVLRKVAEKLEHFAASFRQHGSLDQGLRVDSWLDDELALLSGARSLLPVKQKLSPRLNTWPETQAAMMPAKKTRAKRAGDEAYGACEASGKKAKKIQKTTSVSASTAAPPSAPDTVEMPILSMTCPFQPQVQAPPPKSQPNQNYYRTKTYQY